MIFASVETLASLPCYLLACNFYVVKNKYYIFFPLSWGEGGGVPLSFLAQNPFSLKHKS